MRTLLFIGILFVFVHGTQSEEDACFGPRTASGGVTLSAAKACYSGISLHTDATIQAIDSLFGLLRGYYTFYDLAKDAPNSQPLRNPLGWAIYNGTSGGQVDYDALHKDLVRRVEREGANLLTAFDVSDAILMSRDAHTGVPSTFLNNGVLADATVSVIDENETGDQDIPDRYLTLHEQDGMVSVVFKSTSGRVLKTVTEIDDRDALEYLEWLAAYPGTLGKFSFGLYKSSGSRMQALLAFSSVSGPAVFMPFGVGNIFDLPDQVEVKFDDGSSTTWLYSFNPGKDPEGNDFAAYSVQGLTQYANTQPANGPYAILKAALTEGMTPVTEIPDYPEVSSNANQDQTSSQIGSISNPVANNPMNWTFVNDANDRPLFGFTNVGDATVMKFMSFSLRSKKVSDTVEVCSLLFEYGKGYGSRKLIIDLIDNGGGDIDQSFLMTQCFYPQATFSQLLLPYQHRLSPLQLQGKQVASDSMRIRAAIGKDQNVMIAISEILSGKNIKQTIQTLDSMRGILKAILSLVSSDPETVCATVPESQNALPFLILCDNIRVMSRMIERIEKTARVESADVLVLLQLPTYDVVSAASFSDGWSPNSKEEYDTVIQGGVSTEILTNWTKLMPDVYADGSIAGESLPENPFTRYYILGNGLGGSSSSLLEDNMEQISMLHPSWTPTETVTFGCAGQAATCPPNQFQGGKLSNAALSVLKSYGVAGLVAFTKDFISLVVSLGGSDIPTEYTTLMTDYISQVDDYISALPLPPRGASAEFSRFQMTSNAVLPKVIGWDTIPMEYFEAPPSMYIPYWPNPESYWDVWTTDEWYPLYSQIAS